jgi:uncharacterized protein YuzE
MARGKTMELKLQSFRISLVLNSFFFPLTSPEVFEALKARGFDVGRPPVPLPTGLRVYLTGTIARKNNILIDIDENRNLVGASGESIENAIQIFSEILSMLREDFVVNLDTELNYVELIAHYLIKSSNNPFEILQNCSGMKFKDIFQKILGTQVSEYRYSIVPSGILPTSRNWFEISISPKLTLPTQAYWVEVIFRNTTHETVTAFASNLNSTISNIINTVEGTGLTEESR